MADRNMDVLWTLEDLFYNVDDLSKYDILKWVGMRHPEYSQEQRLLQAEYIWVIYVLWRRGQIFIDGDDVGMREWHGGQFKEVE